MSMLTFPCRPSTLGRPTVGTPDRAEPCKCTHPWPDDDHCIRCGHDSQATIDRTWQLRAIALSGRRKPKAAAA